MIALFIAAILTLDCAGQTGHNFGPCEGWQRPDAIQYTQAGDGGGSTADAPASAESAAPGTCK